MGPPFSERKARRSRSLFPVVPTTCGERPSKHRVVSVLHRLFIRWVFTVHLVTAQSGRKGYRECGDSFGRLERSQESSRRLSVRSLWNLRDPKGSPSSQKPLWHDIGPNPFTAGQRF